MIHFNDLRIQYRALEVDIRLRMGKVFEHGQFVMGPEIIELEERLANYVGVRHCITTSSGTDSLLIAMMALGIGRGHEVITTPFSFISCAETIVMLGATPIFVDINPETYNLDASKIESVITPQTRAIMPVSLFGQCADMDAINSLAARHNLPVIEDGAQSFGATYNGKRSCNLSTIGSTSFFPSKPLGAYGDGGALFTNDEELAKTMRKIRVHGQERRYHHSHLGINGRLDTLQAAILLAKFDRFDWEVSRRKYIGSAYSAKIANQCPWVKTPLIDSCNTSVYSQYTIQLDSRDEISRKLNQVGIPTAVYYPIPLHRQPVFSELNLTQTSLDISEAVAPRVLSLPMGADLDEEVQNCIVSALREATISHSEKLTT